MPINFGVMEISLMSQQNLPHKLLSDPEAAELLCVNPQTLAVWRCKKRYNLPYIKVGRKVRYREADILDWLNSRTQRFQQPTH
jgi:predicted DNA-binding transcriptional regulator AlpA